MRSRALASWEGCQAVVDCRARSQVCHEVRRLRMHRERARRSRRFMAHAREVAGRRGRRSSSAASASAERCGRSAHRACVEHRSRCHSAPRCDCTSAQLVQEGAPGLCGLAFMCAFPCVYRPLRVVFSSRKEVYSVRCKPPGRFDAGQRKHITAAKAAQEPRRPTSDPSRRSRSNRSQSALARDRLRAPLSSSDSGEASGTGAAAHQEAPQHLSATPQTRRSTTTRCTRGHTVHRPDPET
mmetsp:Transcript_2604/g.10896  ORF Transcript_2604/g.10896 Transcript_2604/m.10896 type:complete len:240 (-) Transcript_2604:227-946(-)